MNIFKFIFQNSFAMLSICAGGYSYIVITKEAGGDTFLGICSFAITLIFAMIVYRALEWLAFEMETLRSQSPNSNSKVNRDSGVSSIISLPFTSMTMPKAYLNFHESTNSDFIDVETEPLTDNENETIEEWHDGRKALLDELKEYTKVVFKPFVRESDLPILLQILEDYSNCNMNCTPFTHKPTELNGITAKDIMHYGWNIWARLKPMNRQSTARFLKTAFPEILKETKTSSVYAKMTCDEGSFRIKIIKADESLL